MMLRRNHLVHLHAPCPAAVVPRREDVQAENGYADANAHQIAGRGEAAIGIRDDRRSWPPDPGRHRRPARIAESARSPRRRLCPGPTGTRPICVVRVRTPRTAARQWSARRSPRRQTCKCPGTSPRAGPIAAYSRTTPPRRPKPRRCRRPASSRFAADPGPVRLRYAPARCRKGRPSNACKSAISRCSLSGSQRAVIGKPLDCCSAIPLLLCLVLDAWRLAMRAAQP